MESIVRSPNCQKTLVEPVFLLCCHTVCQKHETDASILCENGFPRNVLVQSFLDKQLAKAIGSLKGIKLLVDDLTRLLEWPEYEIKLVEYK